MRCMVRAHHGGDLPLGLLLEIGFHVGLEMLTAAILLASTSTGLLLIGGRSASSPTHSCSLKARGGREVSPASVAANGPVTVGTSQSPAIYAGRSSGALMVVGVLGKPVDDHHAQRYDHYS